MHVGKKGKNQRTSSSLPKHLCLLGTQSCQVVSYYQGNKLPVKTTKQLNSLWAQQQYLKSKGLPLLLCVNSIHL